MPNPFHGNPRFAALLLLVLASSSVFGQEDPFQAADAAYQKDILPLLKTYCYECHGNERQKAGLNLEAFATAKDVVGDRERWEIAQAFIEDGDMPPPDFKAQPTEDEVALLSGWIQSTLSQVDCNLSNPGRVTLRRLNRAEYNNTVRDLLGIEFKPADDFPADNVGYGFDNIGDVLSIDPLLLEKYMMAAEEIAKRAIDTRGPEDVPAKSWRDNDLRAFGGERHNEGRILANNGVLEVEHEFPGTGQYLIQVGAFGQQAGDEPVRMAVQLDGITLEEFSVEAENRPRRYSTVTRIEAGKHRLSIVFLNDYYDETAEEGKRDRNLIVGEVRLTGPGDSIETIELEQQGDEAGGAPHGVGRILASSGAIKVRPKLDGEGEYRFLVKAFGDQAGTEPVRMAFHLDGQPITTFDVRATEQEPGIHEARLWLPPGEHEVALEFINDYYRPDDENPDLRGDRNLVVDQVKVIGPMEGYYERVPQAHREVVFEPLLTPTLEETTRKALERLASRAYRRPATPDEVDRLCAVARMVREDGGTPEESLQFALEAVLISPSFLYRVEYGGSPDPKMPEGVQPLSPFELASRLSYFLWSSMPDEELLDAAQQDRLKSPEELESQVRRMLADPRSTALVDNFASQWLQIRNLETIQPDNETFPQFSDRLRSAMIEETRLFVESIIREDRDILEFLEADYTFVNESLARLYGIKDVRGNEFRRVELDPGLNRGGILTQASILTVTSNPTRTSPVKRGKWILEQVLGTPPPPPPPDVPPLPEEGPEVKGSLRERLEIHRSTPGCATCHERMDPIGFAFENYNAIGAWRDQDGEFEIDPSGVLPSGESFDGPAAFKALLRARSSEFSRCLTEKLMTYALGRGLEYFDRCAVDEIAARLEQGDRSFSRMVVEIVQSDPFRFRKTEGSE